ncbi:MAG: site-specific integrase, partial [Paraprevotella sp.]|nr:site-specific integrase [Paraprevotella sp.]
MATIKVKLRFSSVTGRAGTIFYQVTHRRAIQQITTNIRLQPNEWDATREQVAVRVADRNIIQNRIDSDTALLKRIVKDLENSGITYSVCDIVKR